MTDEHTYSLLVPRYLRGELSTQERADFDLFVDNNPDFKAEIEFQRNLMAARPEDNTSADMEFGWAKLSRSIDALDEAAMPSPQAANDSVAPSRFSHMWKVAAAALACLSIGQGLYISNSKAPEYQLASEEELQGTTLQLSFNADVSFKQASDLIAGHNAQIIAGPSKLGIYTLSFTENENCLSMISTLTSKDSLVDTYTSCTTRSKG